MFSDLTQALAARLHSESCWPTEALAQMQEQGCFRAAIPEPFGGLGASPLEQLELYGQVAAAGLSLALILTQHDGACQFLQASDNGDLRRELSRAIARGEGLATIGISQLTTSHQSGPPALSARAVDGGYVLDGFIPWVTSAAHARWMVVGAVSDDRQQLLLAIENPSEGLEVMPPFELMALDGSFTSRVACRGLFVAESQRLKGPSQQVLARRSPVKSLSVSAVGLGVAQALLECSRELPLDASLQPFLELGQAQWEQLRQRLRQAAQHPAGADKAASQTLRAESNALLIRLASTALTFAKGSGYTRPHRAQQLVREAMFLLVWSAPTDLRRETLSQLWAGSL